LIEKRRKPVPVPPAAIAWTAMVMRHVQRQIGDLPEEGEAEELRVALASLFERFDFANQVRKPFRRTAIAPDIPRAALDIRGLESVRRAIAAAIRSFKYAGEIVSRVQPSPIKLSSFIDEVERCLRSQALSVGAANRDGLRVLEATDVRGLRFSRCLHRRNGRRRLSPAGLARLALST